MIVNFTMYFLRSKEIANKCSHGGEIVGKMNGGLERFIRNFIPDKLSSISTGKVESIKGLLVDLKEEERESLLFLWKKYGFTSFNQGKLSLVDPYEYAPLLQGFSMVTDKVIPFFRTALGAFFMWDYLDDEFVITYLDVHHNENLFQSDTLSDLLEYWIGSQYSWEEELNGELEDLAVQNFPQISESECIGFIPHVSEIVVEDVRSMKKINHKTYLEQLLFHHESNKKVTQPIISCEMDKNLKLIIINKLIHQKMIAFDRAKFLKEQGWTKYRVRLYENKPIIQIENYFLKLNLADYPLDEISFLSYDSSPKTIHDIWLLWDWDNGEYFDIKSLEGIECLKNLEILDLKNLILSDLTPLTKLKKLRSLEISLPCALKLETFYKLPVLEKLDLNAPPYTEEGYYDDFANKMAQKGVELTINNIKW